MKRVTIIEQQSGDYFTLYDNDLGSILRKFQGLEFADVRESIDDVAGPYGSVYVNAKHGPRLVTIEGDLVGSNVFANRRLLARALRVTGVIKLIKFTTYDDLDLQFEAEIVKNNNPYVHTVHTFQLQLKAPDWRLYSQELKSFDIARTNLRGGGTIPGTMPFAIPLSTDPMSDLVSILDNLGDEATDPIFTITGPGTTFFVGNDTTGKDFNLPITLLDGDEVVIDVKRRTVIKNGITNLYGSLDGDFWSINPGENDIRFLVSSGATQNTNLNISYRDAYNGI